MQIIANGQVIPFTVNEEENLSDVLKTLLLLTNQANKLVIECKVNGELIPLLERDKYTEKPVESIQKIEMLVENKGERIIESLKEMEHVFPIIIDSFSEISNTLIAGQKHKALTKFSETLKMWRQLINFLRVIEASFKLNFKEIEVNGKKIDDASAELYDILNEIKKAIVNEDLVTIGDLIEYELKSKIEEQRNICTALQKIVQEKAEKQEKENLKQ
ncbi:MAG: hypothetical protein KKH94_01930 [Candidatus Omnitrophica bacterium]|nr:hypothetical protein [Candidatus Omnitrophota bacterium]